MDLSCYYVIYLLLYLPHLLSFSLSLILSLSLSLTHTCTHTQTRTHAHTLSVQLPKMAAASSIQPPSVHSSLAGESALSPEMDSPESRQPEDEEAAAAQPSDSGISLRDLPDLEPEEIERRLAKTRQELSNRRKILIKNLPPDTTNQVLCAGKTGGKVAGFTLAAGFYGKERWKGRV